MKTKFGLIVFSLLWVSLLGFAPAHASLQALFQKHRSDGDTVLYLNNGDVLHGDVLTETFGIHTPYGYVQVPTRECAGIFLNGSPHNREMIVSNTMNLFTGIIDPVVIRFHIRSTASKIDIRKEEIRHIIMGFPGGKTIKEGAVSEEVLLIMVNGDLLSGKLELPALTLKIGESEVSVPVSDIRAIDVSSDTAIPLAEIRKTDGGVLKGFITIESFRLQADGDVSIDSIYLNRVDGIRLNGKGKPIADLFWKAADIYPERPRSMRSAAEKEHLVNSIGMKFQRIHPGSFMMGSDDGRFDEKPAHRVMITRPFYMSVYEATQEAWEKIMGKNPSAFKGPKRPVENVSWQEAQEFCRRLSAAEGVHYRLPTEAEWEFACRAGTLTRYFWGDTFDGDYAWCWFNSDGQTQPVGLKNPNPWGLHDMVGNVVEWCEDGFALYLPGEVSDPVISSGNTRTLRGGGWDSHPEICRSSFRLHLNPSDRSDSIGFRIVREE